MHKLLLIWSYVTSMYKSLDIVYKYAGLSQSLLSVRCLYYMFGGKIPWFIKQIKSVILFFA